MANKDLFAQAIADAKKLKEISLENAKQAIEEAFAPRIQEMFRLKLSEMEEMEEAPEHEAMEEAMDSTEETVMEKEHDTMDEATLDEILAELELEEYSEEQPETITEAEEEEEKEEEGEEENNEEVAELSIDEFKDLIKDVVTDVLASQGGAEEETPAEDEEEAPAEEEGAEKSEDEEVINLDEITDEEEEPIDLDEILQELKDEEETKKEDLQEAIRTINALKSQLNEVNLLNAKLLYVNKIFKAKSLTESQKVKVVTAFDRATTLKEAKNIYETLKDSLTTTTAKAPIKESFGFASKPVGSAPARPIVEADSYVHRMQQLAGLRQPNI